MHRHLHAVAQVPEVRLISLLVMTIVGCVKPGNVRRFTGGSEDVCRTGGAWYSDHACGLVRYRTL